MQQTWQGDMKLHFVSILVRLLYRQSFERTTYAIHKRYAFYYVCSKGGIDAPPDAAAGAGLFSMGLMAGNNSTSLMSTRGSLRF